MMSYEESKNCKCRTCEWSDKTYFRDNENGHIYAYDFSQNFLCMKYNRFVINGKMDGDMKEIMEEKEKYNL